MSASPSSQVVHKIAGQNSKIEKANEAMRNDQTLDTRLSGRMFPMDGCLCLVLNVNSSEDVAKVSVGRADKTNKIVDMPLSDLMSRLAKTSQFQLDGLNSKNTAKRLLEQDDQWFFHTREGLQGPFECRDSARQALSKYILSAQEGIIDQVERPEAIQPSD